MSDWSSDVCSSDLYAARACVRACVGHEAAFLKRMGIDQRSVHSPPARRRPLRRRIAAENGRGDSGGRIVGKPELRRWQIELGRQIGRSEEHTSELQSLMRISYAVFCLKKKNKTNDHTQQCKQ